MHPMNDIRLMVYLLIILWAAAAYDLRTYKIPNFITLPSAAGAIIYYGVLHGFEGVVFSLLGWTTGVLLLLLPYAIGGMGAGDVKLLGVVGASLGAKAVLGAFLYAAVAGGIYALILIAWHRKYFQGFFQHLFYMFCIVLATRQMALLRDAAGPAGIRLKYGLAITLGATFYILSKTTEINMLFS